ncbi:MAG TPA: hypothetical protein VF950_29890 [Planctomycetota bacterium]
MGRVTAFLLLAGCAGRDPAADLDVRLLARGPFALGQPMFLALEATNRGSRELRFDVQGLMHGPYGVRTSDGRDVPYVDPRMGGLGTLQDFVSLKPGETATLDQIDLAYQFAILDPGEYVARFRGLDAWGQAGWADESPDVTRVPASAPLRFSVGPGTLSPRDRALRALLPALPEGWIVYKDGDGLTFQKNRIEGTGLRAVVSFTLPDTVSPLRLMGKADRTPADDVLEAELQTTLLAPLRTSIEKALR